MKKWQKFIAMILVVAFLGSMMTSCKSSKCDCPKWSKIETID